MDNMKKKIAANPGSQTVGLVFKSMNNNCYAIEFGNMKLPQNPVQHIEKGGSHKETEAREEEVNGIHYQHQTAERVVSRRHQRHDGVALGKYSVQVWVSGTFFDVFCGSENSIVYSLHPK